MDRGAAHVVSSVMRSSQRLIGSVWILGRCRHVIGDEVLSGSPKADYFRSGEIDALLIAGLEWHHGAHSDVSDLFSPPADAPSLRVGEVPSHGSWVTLFSAESEDGVNDFYVVEGALV